MTAPEPMSVPTDAAESIVLAALRQRCAVVLIGASEDNPDEVWADEIHNRRSIDDRRLAFALRQLADRIDARAQPTPPL